MPRQSSIDAAYSPVGGKQHVSIKCSKFCISLIFTVLVTFVFFVGTGGNDKPHKEFQSGQATMIYKAPETSKSGSNSAYPESIVLDDENIQIVLDEATEQIQDAEIAQLAVESKEIDTMTTKITNHLRIGIGKLFGTALSNDEMEAVATEVQTQLKDETQKKLRSKADIITENAIATIEKKVSDDEEKEMDESEIEESVLEDQKKAVRDVKYRIDAELSAVQKQLPTRAIEIEKAILEERLSLKLGKRVKLVIDEDNEISTTSSDDELFNGLSSLNNKTPKATSSSYSGSPHGYTSSSTSRTSANKYEPSVVPPLYEATTATSSYSSSKANGSLSPKKAKTSYTSTQTFPSATLYANTTKTGVTAVNSTSSTNVTMKNVNSYDGASTPTTKSTLYNQKKKKPKKIGGII